MPPRIYDYTQFSAYLAAYMAARKELEPDFTYRSFAAELGRSTHNLLVMIATGKRLPAEDLLSALAKATGMTEAEAGYARALVGLERAKTAKEREFYAEKLEALRPQKERRLISADLIEYISQWYNVGILEMTRLADFRPDPDWIAARLGGVVTPATVATSLALLLRLGLLREGPDGRLMRSEEGLTSTGQIPSEAIRSFHKQLLAMATLAIDAQPVGRRYFSGTSLTLDVAALPAAFDLIVEFRNKFSLLTQKDGGTGTYHLGIQLFSLTAP